jgi:hypothetical protein
MNQKAFKERYGNRILPEMKEIFQEINLESVAQFDNKMLNFFMLLSKKF